MCPEIIIFLKWTLKSFIVKRQKWKKCHRFDDWKGELIQKKKKALWCVLDRIKIPTKVNKVIIIYSKTSEYSGHTELLTNPFFCQVIQDWNQDWKLTGILFTLYYLILNCVKCKINPVKLIQRFTTVSEILWLIRTYL